MHSGIDVERKDSARRCIIERDKSSYRASQELGLRRSLICLATIQPHNYIGEWLPGISGLGVAGVGLDAAIQYINPQVA